MANEQNQDIHFDEIIARYRADPYNYIKIRTLHTGLINFRVKEDSAVEAPSGQWKHIPGTALYEITRERNKKIITSETNGAVCELRDELDGQFVEAGERILTIRHPLKKKEIIESILREVLFLFAAPERAKYYFALDIQSRIEKKGARAVSVHAGDELFTMSLMKRDTPLLYQGEPGIIHSVYFKPGDSVGQGTPLVGICPKDKLPLIQKIITRVKAEWE